MKMRPERSREWIYKKYKHLENRYTYINESEDDIKHVIHFNNEDDINHELTGELLSLFRCVFKTLSDIPVSNIIKNIDVYIVNRSNILVIIEPFEHTVGLVVGRKSANLFSLKRFVSNISGKYQKQFNSQLNITIDIKQFIE